MQWSKIKEKRLRIIAVVGPTSSGKSELAVRLAKKFNGEVISCDSRQIYKGMNLGTGKIPGKWHVTKKRGRAFCKHYVYRGVVHHLIDFVDPKSRYSAAVFQKQARKAIRDVSGRGHLPILCGGTGHWIDAVVFDQRLPEVKPNLKLRAKLEKESADDLYRQLKNLDPARARNIDRYNKRRLIRALEIVLTTGKPVPRLSKVKGQMSNVYNILWLGLTLPQSRLYRKIEQRLKQRFKQGLVRETERLHQQGLPWKKLEDFGLTYRFAAQFLQKKIDRKEMLQLSLLSEKHYTKRQMTWFKRNKDINWMSKPARALPLATKFLKQ